MPIVYSLDPNVRRATVQSVISHGGQWLATARSWIQRNARNGSQVTWGSGDVLRQGPLANSAPVEFTVRMVEDLAKEVASTMYLSCVDVFEAELRGLAARCGQLGDEGKENAIREALALLFEGNPTPSSSQGVCPCGTKMPLKEQCTKCGAPTLNPRLIETK